jgi:hypothetical protein
VAQTPVRLRGSVIDATTSEPLSFAYIIINQGVAGGNTDLNGLFNFEINTSVEKITFKRIGYQDFVYEVNAPADLQPLQRFLQIPLTAKSETFRIDLPDSLNPAHKIIEQVLRNRDFHNPKSRKFYSYVTHSKFAVDLEQVSKIQMPSPKDSTKHKIALFTQNNHIFFAETVTKYQFRQPFLQHEQVLANKVAGLENPEFLALNAQAQLFNFYEDYLEVLKRKYLNPISPQAWKRYKFTLEDTTLVKPDTIFWISFQPLPNKQFDGLKGRLAIHTRSYAIQAMEIESAVPEKFAGFGFKIAQQNEWVNKQYWFPKQVRTEFMLRRAKIGNRRIIAQWQMRLTDFDFQKKPSLRLFRDIALDTKLDSNVANIWAKYRIDSLTKKEKNTLLTLDTLGKKNKLDQQWQYVRMLPFGRIPIKRFKADFALLRSFDFNRYEFIRLGADFLTNQTFSKKYTLGGYINYGTRDGNFKYGFSAQYRPFTHIDASLTARYISDVREPARVRFEDENAFVVLGPNRNFFIERMDKIRNFDLKLQGKILQNARLKAIFRTKRVLPTYDYTFTKVGENGENEIYAHHFQITELNFQFQYFFGTQYVQADGLRGLLKQYKPAFYLSYTQGMRALGSHFRYGKWEARLVHEHTFTHIGTTQGELWLGLATGKLPYHVLWNGQGTGKYVPPMIPNYFQTMGTYEFLTDRFAYLFLRHNFRKWLYKSPIRWLQPEPVLHHNMGWGGLRSSEAHQGIITETFKRGHLESGFMLNNLLMLKIKPLKIGIGGGTFLRYGAHRIKHDFSKNVAYKFSLNIGV